MARRAAARLAGLEERATREGEKEKGRARAARRARQWGALRPRARLGGGWRDVSAGARREGVLTGGRGGGWGVVAECRKCNVDG